MSKDSYSSSESFVSTTTNTVTDSYNQAFSRVENLSNSGNVTIQGNDAISGGGPSPMMIVVLLGAVVAGIFILRKLKR